MTLSKRLMDIVISLLLMILLCPLFLILLIILAIFEGRPIFYISEQMKTPTQGFALLKLRTMSPSLNDGGVTGGDKSARMSPLHRLLRKTRADELPQIYNVMRGDISLVGPRPPLLVYVDAFPEIYGRVLRIVLGSRAWPQSSITPTRKCCWADARMRHKLMRCIGRLACHVRHVSILSIRTKDLCVLTFG